jgi:hypothetical protein
MKKFHHSQSLRQIKGGFFSLLLLVAFANCTGELPLSDLINNTITLKVMGTYESNNPYALGFTDANLPANIRKDDVITAGAITGTNVTLTGAPPDVVAFANAIKPSDLQYYIDIAEIRLAKGQGKSSSQTIADYWSQFAIDRQLMCSDYATADGRSLANCRDQNGIGRLSEFFNGGFTYPAVDVPFDTFNHMGIYFRRFAVSPGARFNGDGTYYNGTDTTAKQAVTAAFDNRTIYAFDVESYLQNPYGATSTEPLMFPLQRKDLSLRIMHDKEPYVMEVRIAIHNMMMVHIAQITNNAGTPADSTNGSFVYTAPPDWNVDHKFNDLTNLNRMGGSMLMTARTYQPAKVGSINITGGTATSGEYFAVMPAGTAYATPVSVLPHAATAGTNTTITNLQPGSYDVYRMCDKRRCLTTSTAGTCDATDTTADGFPETAAPCGTYVVYSGTSTPVAIGSCSAACP